MRRCSRSERSQDGRSRAVSIACGRSGTARSPRCRPARRQVGQRYPRSSSLRPLLKSPQIWCTHPSHRSHCTHPSSTWRQAGVQRGAPSQANRSAPSGSYSPPAINIIGSSHRHPHQPPPAPAPTTTTPSPHPHHQPAQRAQRPHSVHSVHSAAHLVVVLALLQVCLAHCQPVQVHHLPPHVGVAGVAVGAAGGEVGGGLRPVVDLVPLDALPAGEAVERGRLKGQPVEAAHLGRGAGGEEGEGEEGEGGMAELISATSGEGACPLLLRTRQLLQGGQPAGQPNKIKINHPSTPAPSPPPAPCTCCCPQSRAPAAAY